MSKEREVGEIIDGWYDATKLNDHVWAIGEPYHGEDNLFYLVKGLDQDVLIDTGMGIKPLNNVLSKIRNGKPLNVINTHAHFDHVGGNKYFPYVLAPKNGWEKELIEQGCPHEVLESYEFEEDFLKVPEGFDISSYEIPPYKNAAAILEDGSVMNLGERCLKVIETPGHTPGSICLLDTLNGALFTSDLIYDGPLYCYSEESIFNDYFNSLLKVQNFINEGIVKQIHPGHNYSTSALDIVKWSLVLFNKVEGREKPDEITEKYYIYKSDFSSRLKLYVKKFDSLKK